MCLFLDPEIVSGLADKCMRSANIFAFHTHNIPSKQATTLHRRTFNTLPARSMQVSKSWGLLPRPGVKKRDNPVSRDAAPSAPDGTQPPLSEATTRSHGSPVFHLATIDESSDIVSAKAGIERVEPSFFRQGVVDCLRLVHMLRWAHGLHL